MGVGRSEKKVDNAFWAEFGQTQRENMARVLVYLVLLATNGQLEKSKYNTHGCILFVDALFGVKTEICG